MGQIVNGTYVPDYEAEDAAPIAFDLILSVAALLVSFAAVIALVLMYRWLKGKKLN